MRLINNTNKENDRMQKCIMNHAKDCHVRIATAFFSDYKDLLEMVSNNCTIDLIVRLDIGTSYDALVKIIDNPKVSVRFFTGMGFHPKFYIFGDCVAYLGSANFTQNGLTTNNEACLEIDSEEPVFEDIKIIFYKYWESAEPLTKVNLEKFGECIKGKELPNIFRNVEAAIGRYEFNNVGREPKSNSSKQKYISEFRKSYQKYIQKFNITKEFYDKSGVRRFPELPLRIEVDRFLWWIREAYAKGESYNEVPEKDLNSIQFDMLPLIQEFESVQHNYLRSDAVTNYTNLASKFSSETEIYQMNYEEIFYTLLNVNAFHDSSRYIPGGIDSLKNEFGTSNSVENIKRTISYLLFGKDDYEERIFNCIYGDYKLVRFGEQCVTELFGIVNQNDIPPRNGRMLKSLQWLGFGRI